MLVIIHPNDITGVSITVPTPEALHFATIQEIAFKDVPHNVPYWIVERDTLPDWAFRDAWQISDTIGDPDGIGGESTEFPAELLEKYYEWLEKGKK
jgi:hypothetical protein